MKKKLITTSTSLLFGILVLVVGISNVSAEDNFGLFNGNVFQNNNSTVNNGASQNCTTGNATSQGGTATSGNCSNDASVGNVINSNQNSDCNCTPTPQPTPTPTPTNPPGGGGQPNGGNGRGGNGGSSCPTNTNLQSVDPVWVTDVTSTSLIVHWSNKGDATAYQIAYGPANNKYQWGVRVGNVNSFQINQIPAGLKVVVTVFPVNGDCAGNASGQPSTLAAAGFASNTPLYITGMVLIGLGLLQAQKRLRIKS